MAPVLLLTTQMSCFSLASENISFLFRPHILHGRVTRTYEKKEVLGNVSFQHDNGMVLLAEYKVLLSSFLFFFLTAAISRMSSERSLQRLATFLHFQLSKGDFETITL